MDSKNNQVYHCLKHLLVILFLSFYCSINAKTVTLSQAQEVVENFWGGGKTRNSSVNLQYVWNSNSLFLDSGSRNSDDQPLFYVFEGVGNKGFVIISAEDRVTPILAYSFIDSAPDPNRLPDGFIDWAKSVCLQIEHVRRMDPYRGNKDERWTNAIAGTVSLELETAKWDQLTPYNNSCPFYNNSRCYAGCVPVATAIIMKYYNWPKQGKGRTESFTTETYGINVGSRDLNHAYNWDKMPLVYTQYGSKRYTDEEAEAVATLIADIGASFRADYGPKETISAIDLKALYEHFDYNPSMTYVKRADYSDEAWIKLVKNEISSLRPMLYRGANTTEAHIFIVDGFTDDDFFHINWGWGGNSNGYYTLSSLTPDGKIGYNSDQMAYINVKPRESSEIEDWITFWSPGIELSETMFEPNRWYSFSKIWFANITAIDFSGSFRGAVTNRNGEIKEWITSELNYSLPTSHYVWYSNVNFIINGKIEIGDRIRFFYRSDDSTEWHLIKGHGDKCQWEVLIADEFYISESTSFSFDKRSKTITLETKDRVDVSLFSPTMEQTYAGLTVTGNKIIIDTSALSSGEYTIRLSKGDDVKELKFSVKPL